MLPKFTLLADDLKKFLLSGQAESYEDGRLGGIILVKSNLTAKSPVLAELAKSGKLKIVTGKYDLDDGAVTLLDGQK